MAQSIIGSAQTQGYIRKLQQYEIAITNFNTNFKSVPGDSPYFTPSGDNDGSSNGAGGCNGIYSGDEWTHIWAHLSQAKMINGDYKAFAPDYCGGDMIDNGAPEYYPDFSKNRLYGSTLTQNGYVPIRLQIWNKVRYYSYNLTASESAALDKKMDDGNCGSGKMTVSETFDDQGNELYPCEVGISYQGLTITGNDYDVTD